MEMDFIKDMIVAARNLGIGLRENGDHFEWLDMATRVIVTGPGDPERSKALFLACEKLRDYLSINGSG